MLIDSLTLALLVLPVSLPASARPRGVLACGEAAAVERRLGERHGEAPVWRGLLADGRLAVLYQSPAGRWTLVAIIPGGPACIVALGEAGAVLAPPMPGKGS